MRDIVPRPIVPRLLSACWSRHADLLLICALYCLAHFPILLNTGLFWDDWGVYGISRDLIKTFYSEAGLPTAYFYHAFVEQGGVFAYRLITFLSFLVASLCVLQILREAQLTDGLSSLQVAAVFALFPVSSARISTVVSWYGFSYALFFAAFWLLSIYLRRRALWLRVTALILFGISFFVHSFLIFYVIVLAYIAYHHRKELTSLSSVFVLGRKYIDFCALPVLFWLIKQTALTPTGVLRGYNDVTLKGLVNAFGLLGDGFIAGFVEVLGNAAGLGFRFAPLTACVWLGLYLYIRWHAARIPPARSAHPTWWFAIGGILVFLALFPYAVVGRIPHSADWDNRHQLLVPLGAALLLVFGLRLFLRRQFQTMALSLLLACFLIANLHTWVAFQRDWYKQLSLVANFRTTPLVKEGRYLLVRDLTRALDANGREYRFYEYAGLLHLALGDEDRLAQEMSSVEHVPFASLRPWLSSRFRLGQFDQRISEPDTVVAIEYGSYPLSLRNLAALRIYETFNESKFKDKIARIVRLCAATIQDSSRTATYSCDRL